MLTRGLRGGMAIYAGTPAEATSHHDSAFMVGLLGAVMTVVCAFALGGMLTGSL